MALIHHVLVHGCGRWNAEWYGMGFTASTRAEEYSACMYSSEVA
jgi:hypothetical protein